MITPQILETAAKTAHEVNRAFCIGLGDTTQLTWDEAPDWQKTSAIKGIETVLTGAGPKEQHTAWMTSKTASGWKYGETKDAKAKTHPCMVPYEELPYAQQLKDTLYITTVKGVLSAHGVKVP